MNQPLNDFISAFIRSTSGNLVPAGKRDFYENILIGAASTRIKEQFVVEDKRYILIEEFWLSQENTMFIAFTDSETLRKRVEFFDDATLGKDFINGFKGSILKIIANDTLNKSK